MKFVLLGDETPDGMDLSVRNALTALGHDVNVFWPGFRPRETHAAWKAWYYAERIRQQWNLVSDGHPFAHLQRAVIDAVKRKQPDAFIVFTLPLLKQETVRCIKEEVGCAIIGWYPDAIVNLGRGDFFSVDYDLIYLKDPYLVEKFGTVFADPRIRFLPEAFDDSAEIPVVTENDREKYACDVMSYGTLYPYRARWMQELSGYDIALYGNIPRWMRGHPVVQFHKQRQLRGREKIIASLSANICLNTAHYSEIRGVNARLWELTGVGAFQLTNLAQAADYFRIGEEVAVFETVTELREAAEHYLHRPDERQVMAEKARQRTLQHHTWKDRAKVVLEDIRALGT